MNKKNLRLLTSKWAQPLQQPQNSQRQTKSWASFFSQFCCLFFFCFLGNTNSHKKLSDLDKATWSSLAGTLRMFIVVPLVQWRRSGQAERGACCSYVQKLKTASEKWALRWTSQEAEVGDKESERKNVLINCQIKVFLFIESICYFFNHMWVFLFLINLFITFFKLRNRRKDSCALNLSKCTQKQ